MIVGSIGHAHKVVGESPRDTTTEELKIKEVTAPAAIHEAKQDMVPNVTRFTTQLVL